MFYYYGGGVRSSKGGAERFAELAAQENSLLPVAWLVVMLICVFVALYFVEKASNEAKRAMRGGDQ